jgi:hypothetical protein
VGGIGWREKYACSKIKCNQIFIAGGLCPRLTRIIRQFFEKKSLAFGYLFLSMSYDNLEFFFAVVLKSCFNYRSIVATGVPKMRKNRKKPEKPALKGSCGKSKLSVAVCCGKNIDANLALLKTAAIRKLLLMRLLDISVQMARNGSL